MPDVTLGDVPFQEAIDHLLGKVKIPTERWDQMRGRIHARAFTVAGATKTALLDDLFNAVADARREGSTITEFRKRFDQAVQDHGWTYKGKRGWRTRVIYDTNMRTSAMAGRWSQFQEVKETSPYLQYLTVGDSRVRDEHREWNRKVLHIDDDWWSTHFPPNGWGCRCTVRSLSPRLLRREGLDIDQAPALDRTERISPLTGEVLGNVPKGIDVGWDYNVGKAWLGPDIGFGEDLTQLAPAIRVAALQSARGLAPDLAADYQPWFDGLIDRKQAIGEIRAIGYLSPSVVGALEARGALPKTALIAARDQEIMHMIRDAKDGKHLSMGILRSLPQQINEPKAVLWDKRDPALLYVFDIADDDLKDGKLVVRVNYKIKGRIDGQRESIEVNNVRTSGLVETRNLADRSVYDVIEGGL